MEEILDCLKATEDLKEALLDQQKLLKHLLIVFNKPKKYRCCPMCETFFETENDDDFEDHVMSHFEVDNDGVDKDTSDDEETLSLQVNNDLLQ